MPGDAIVRPEVIAQHILTFEPFKAEVCGAVGDALLHLSVRNEATRFFDAGEPDGYEGQGVGRRVRKARQSSLDIGSFDPRQELIEGPSLGKEARDSSYGGFIGFFGQDSFAISLFLI